MSEEAIDYMEMPLFIFCKYNSDGMLKKAMVEWEGGHGKGYAVAP